MPQMMPDEFSILGKNYNFTSLIFSNNRLIFEHGLDAIVDSMSRSPAGQARRLVDLNVYKPKKL